MLYKLFIPSFCASFKNGSMNDFLKLSLSEKYTFISDHGKYLCTRSYYNYSINLYLVGNSFFELWYFSPDYKIEKIELLDDIGKIDLYIISQQIANLN